MVQLSQGTTVGASAQARPKENTKEIKEKEGRHGRMDENEDAL
jgi:hypothetical protein